MRGYTLNAWLYTIICTPAFHSAREFTSVRHICRNSPRKYVRNVSLGARVSESGFIDDGGLIVTLNCAFAHTIGPKKDGHTHIRRLRNKVFVNVTDA